MSGLNRFRGTARKPTGSRMPGATVQLIERDGLPPWRVGSCGACPVVIHGIPNESAAVHFVEVHTCPQNTGIRLHNHGWDSQNGEVAPSYA